MRLWLDPDQCHGLSTCKTHGAPVEPQEPSTGALAATAGIAVGQPCGPGLNRGPGMGRGPALARMADPPVYLEGLKGQLGITAQQATPWDAYAEVVKSKPRRSRCRTCIVRWERCNRHMAGTAGCDESNIRRTAESLLGGARCSFKARACSYGLATDKGGWHLAWATPGPMGPGRRWG